MLQIDRVKAEIETLSPNDFARLREWIIERDWKRWDDQIENDAQAGKLDFLREEALASKSKGKLSDL